MQVEIEDVSPVEKKLTVEIPWDTVKGKLGEAYNQLSKTVALKGFRRGKVPRSVIKQMFGKQVRAEVAGELMRDSVLQAVTEHELAIVAEPHVQGGDIKSGEALKFEASVEVKGEITLEKSQYEGLEIQRRAIDIGDDAIEHQLEQLVRENTDLEPIEGRDKAESTDVLVVAIKGTVGDQEIDRPQAMVDLGEPSNEPLPGLVAALTGPPLDTADKEITLEIPAGPGAPIDGDDDGDDGDEADEGGEQEAAPQQAVLTVSIVDARQKNVPTVDDEFAKDTGKADTLDELKKVLRTELEERAEEEIKRDLRQKALEALVKGNQVPVAPSLIQRAIDNQVYRLAQMFGGAENIDPKMFEDMRDRMQDSAGDEVRGELLLEAVGTLESIEVTDDEVAAKIEEMAASQGGNAARLRAELDRDGRLDNLRFSLQRDKTLDLLVDRAAVTDAPPEPDPETGAGDGDEAAASDSDEPETSGETSGEKDE